MSSMLQEAVSLAIVLAAALFLLRRLGAWAGKSRLTSHASEGTVRLGTRLARGVRAAERARGR